MTKEKNNTGLIIFLCIIILILGVVTYLSLTGTITLSKNNSNNETQEENTTK